MSWFYICHFGTTKLKKQVTQVNPTPGSIWSFKVATSNLTRSFAARVWCSLGGFQGFHPRVVVEFIGAPRSGGLRSSSWSGVLGGLGGKVKSLFFVRGPQMQCCWVGWSTGGLQGFFSGWVEFVCWMALRTKASVWTTAYGGIVRQNTWLARCQFRLYLQALIWHTRVLLAQHLDASRWTQIASLESLNLVRTFQIRFDSTLVKNGNFTKRLVSIGYRVWSYSCKSYNVYSCKSWTRCSGVFCRSSTIVSAANEKMIVKRGYSSRTDPKKCSSQKKTQVTSSWHLRMVSWKWWWSSSLNCDFPQSFPCECSMILLGTSRDSLHPSEAFQIR